MSALWSYALAGVGILGIYLAGRRSWVGWAVGVGAQALWIVYALASDQPGFILSALAYAAVYGRNWWKWTRRGESDEADAERVREKGGVMSEFASPVSDWQMCPEGPHRGPEGPNEDLAQCPRCWSISWALRPEGETFGHHLPDCSLPLRHEGYCVGGGSGHPPAAKVRG